MKKIVFLLAIMAVLTFSCNKKDAPTGVYLAKVGTEKIMESNFQREYDALPDYARLMFEGPEGGQKLLDEIIKKELLYQEAKKGGYEKSKDFQERMEEFRKLTLISEIFDKEVIAKAAVTEQDARKFFDENKEKFVRRDQIRARHILVNTENDAINVLARLKKGDKFEKIAGEISVDKATSKNGGDLGFFSRGEMVPAFENVAFRLNKGEISKPVKTPMGYHVIEVLDIKEGSAVEFSSIKDMIIQKLSGEKQKKVFEEYIASLKKQYKIDVNNDALARVQKKLGKGEKSVSEMQNIGADPGRQPSSGDNKPIENKSPQEVKK